MRLLARRPTQRVATRWGRYTSALDALKIAYFKQTFTDFHTLAIGYTIEKCIQAFAKAKPCAFQCAARPSIGQVTGGGALPPPVHLKLGSLSHFSWIFTPCQRDTMQQNKFVFPPRPGNAPFGALASPASGK